MAKRRVSSQRRSSNDYDTPPPDMVRQVRPPAGKSSTRPRSRRALPIEPAADDQLGQVFKEISRLAGDNARAALDEYRKLWIEHQTSATESSIEEHAHHTQTARRMQLCFDDLYRHKGVTQENLRSLVNIVQKEDFPWCDELEGLGLYMHFGSSISREFLLGLRTLAEIRVAYRKDNEQEREDTNEGRPLTFEEAINFLREEQGGRKGARGSPARRGVSKDVEWTRRDCVGAAARVGKIWHVLPPPARKRKPRTKKARDSGIGDESDNSMDKNFEDGSNSATGEQGGGEPTKKCNESAAKYGRKKRVSAAGGIDKTGKHNTPVEDEDDRTVDDNVHTRDELINDAEPGNGSINEDDVPSPERGRRELGTARAALELRDRESLFGAISAFPHEGTTIDESSIFDDVPDTPKLTLIDTPLARCGAINSGPSPPRRSTLGTRATSKSMSISPPLFQLAVPDFGPISPTTTTSAPTTTSALHDKPYDEHFSGSTTQAHLPSTMAHRRKRAAPSTTSDTPALVSKLDGEGRTSQFKRVRLDPQPHAAANSRQREYLQLAHGFFSAFAHTSIRPAGSDHVVIHDNSNAEAAYIIAFLPVSTVRDTSQHSSDEHLHWQVVYINYGKAQPTDIIVHADSEQISRADLKAILEELALPGPVLHTIESASLSFETLPPVADNDQSDDLQSFVSCVAIVAFLIVDEDIPVAISVWAWIGAMATICAVTDDGPRLSDFTRKVELPQLPRLPRSASKPGTQPFTMVEEWLTECRAELQARNTQISALAEYATQLQLIRKCADGVADVAAGPTSANLASIDQRLHTMRETLRTTPTSEPLYQILLDSICKLEQESVTGSQKRTVNRPLVELKAWVDLNTGETNAAGAKLAEQRNRLIGRMEELGFSSAWLTRSESEEEE